jgi:hypothetical protein
VLALGIFGVDPMELLRLARTEQPRLPIFIIGDRDGTARPRRDWRR